MKKALITGITGQDGSYLAEFLLEKGYEVHGLIRRSSISNTGRIDHLIREDKIVLHGGDMTDSTSLVRIIGEVRPDEIYNLAAQSHVKVSFDVPEYTAEVNSLQELLAGMKLQQEKGNISLMEMSRLESMLFSLKKEKNERENELLTLRGELNVLLNLPGDTTVKLSLDEEVLKQLDLSQLSFADLKAMVNERPDLKIARSTVSASRANLKLQKSMAFPEFSVKGNYDRAGNFINNYFAVGVSLSVPIFNRNQGNIKAARFSIQQAGAEQENAANRADMELYTAYASLEKAVQLYQSTNMDLERNFEKLITGVNENFTKRNISLLEFIDYYDSYKETCIQLHEIKKDVFLAMENLNTTIGQTILNY